MIEEAYRRHPDYLFARVNYAEICIHRNELEAIPVIFNHKFDLKLLYPRRKKFHTSEMIAFMGILGLYFHETGDRALAKNAYEVLYRLAPDHTYTKRLRQLLYPNLLAWFLENMK